MKRLRDEHADTPLMQKAQLLIDAVDPVPESRARMLRIRRQLDQPRPRFAAIRRLLVAPHRRFAAARPSALALATLVVLFGASAFAAVRIFVERLAPAAAPSAPASPSPAVPSEPTPVPARPAPSEAVPAESAATESAPIGSTPTAAAPAEPAPAAPASPAPKSAPTLTTPARRTAPRVHAKARPVVEAPSAVGSDSVLVHRALKALRHDNDPALAARLLLENRAQNSGGPLAEEALSLQIEAASALRDPKARQFAREYLNRYPDGRYLSVARRALAEGL